MVRTLFCLGALGVLVSPCRAESSVSGSETLIGLSVAPAPAPSPALRYRLLPELDEMNPGNPIQGYFQAFMAHQKFFVDEEASGRLQRLLAMPLKAMPAHEVQDYGRLVLDQADLAARLDRPDWQILPGLKTDGFNLLLPDVQQLRSLANALKVRLRSEVALGQFDEAIRTAKTVFAMAHHLAEHPTVIGNLVGIAIAFTAIETFEELLEQPGCPNLYWALTTLPTPFVSVCVGMEGERTMILAELRELDELAPMDAGRIKSFVERWDRSFLDGQAERRKRLQTWLDSRAKDDWIVGAALQRLIKSGLPEDRLRRFPARQVLLLDQKRECLVRFDDMMKTISLPIWQIETRSGGTTPKLEPAVLADDVVPHMKPGRRAQARLEQRIALLRHVEALRLHAAENGGALPATLSDVSVPLPNDPFTGKPFLYELRDGAAHIRGSPPPGDESSAPFNIHYKVTLHD